MEEEIDLRIYIEILRRWWWLIVLGAVLAGAAAYIVSAWFIAPVYQASTQLLVQPSSAYGSSTSYQDVLAGQRVAATYAEIIKSATLREAVLREMGFTEESVQYFMRYGFPAKMTVQQVRDTQLIEIAVESTDPKLAMEYANATAQVFIADNQNRQAARYETTEQEILAQMSAVQEDLARLRARLPQVTDSVERGQIESQIAQLQDSLSRYSSAYQGVALARLQSVDLISVVKPARLPEKPIRPRKSTNAAVAAVLGAVAVVGVVFLREMLDTSVKTPDEAQSLAQAPILGQIWYEDDIASSNGTGQKIVIHKPLSLTAEAFRLLRTNLQFAAVDSPLRALLVTSPSPTEGKSTISLNLALALAVAGQKVIIVDADMRRPKIHRYAATDREPGLSDALVSRESDVQSYLRPIGDVENVWVLPAGKMPPNPTELLGSRRMSEVLAACKEIADVVIVDSPPMLAAADAVVLAGQTDGMLLVIEPGSTVRKALGQAVEQIRQSGASLLGTVLNKVPTEGKGGYYYHYYYYHYYYYYYYYSDDKKPASIWDKLLPWKKSRRKHKRRRKSEHAHAASQAEA